jgi:small subunit ribosomal protein S1
MVHLSDLSWDEPGEKVVQKFRRGDHVKAKVLDIDVEKERISLGVKQLQGDPFADSTNDLNKGDVVTCQVSKILDNGLEVALGQGGASGFIRKTELSRDRSEQRTDRYAVGDKLDAKVISIDRAARRIVLSVKALEIEEEKKAMAEYGSTDSGATLGDILAPAMGKARDEARDKK